MEYVRVMEWCDWSCVVIRSGIDSARGFKDGKGLLR